MILSISYHNEATAKRSYEQLAETTKENPMPVYVLDNNYPLIKDTMFIPNLCERLGFIYVNAGENLGLQGGYNFLLEIVKELNSNVIMYDGDSYPVTNGWNTAMFECLNTQPKVVWVSLQNDSTWAEFQNREYINDTIGKHRVRVVTTPVINSICAFKREWLNEIGGVFEPRKYYGGFEMAMFSKMNRLKHFWVFLSDFSEQRNEIPSDTIYTEYKIKYAHRNMNMSFEEYVKRVDLHGIDNAIS